MKYSLCLLVLCASFSAFAQQSHSAGTVIKCGYSIGVVENRLMNGNNSVVWNNGTKSANYSTSDCDDITPLKHPEARIGTFYVNSSIQCSYSTGRVTEILRNKTATIKWDNNTTSQAFNIDSCENITPINNQSNVSGEMGPGADIKCSYSVGKVQDVLVNGNRSIKWSNGTISRNFNVSSCDDISKMDISHRGGFSENSEIACGYSVGRVLAFLKNGTSNVEWSNGTKSQAFSLSSCENISPVQGEVLSGGFKSGSDIQCSYSVGKIESILKNGNASITWSNGTKSKNFSVSNCENISPVQGDAISDSDRSLQDEAILDAARKSQHRGRRGGRRG